MKRKHLPRDMGGKSLERLRLQEDSSRQRDGHTKASRHECTQDAGDTARRPEWLA